MTSLNYTSSLLPTELIEKQQCSGSEEAVQQRVQKLLNDWQGLTDKSADKSNRLKEANRQRQYTAAVKDLEFWLGEVVSSCFKRIFIIKFSA